MSLLRKARRAWKDIRRGRCSGYPFCCVVFYSFLWEPLIRVEKNKVVSQPHKIYNRLQDWRRLCSKQKRGLGYVACPFHLLRWGPLNHSRCQPACCCGMGDARALSRDKIYGGRSPMMETRRP